MPERSCGFQETLKALCFGVVVMVNFCIVSHPVLGKETPARSLTNQGIADAVNRELQVERTVDANTIDVESEKGIVTLKGTVHTLYAKERASTRATMIKGVRSVVNRLQVIPSRPVNGENIYKRIMVRLVSHPRVETKNMEVVVRDGTVTLKGKVNSWTERSASGTVVKEVEGVQHVVNHLQVEMPLEPRSDQELKQAILARLNLIRG